MKKEEMLFNIITDEVVLKNYNDLNGIDDLEKYKDRFSGILESIDNVKDIYKDKQYILIQFESTVKYVHPLYLILLLEYKHASNKELIFDYVDTRIDVQKKLVRFFRQYLDFKSVGINLGDLSTKKTTKDRQKHFDTMYSKPSATSKQEIYFYNLHKDISLFSHTDFCTFQDKDYYSLPIISLSNYTVDFIKNNEERFLEGIDGQCQEFYMNISVDRLSKQSVDENAHENIDKAIEKIVHNIKKPDFNNDVYKENLLGLENDLSKIFFEIIDNIKKHTKKDDKFANAFISSRVNNEHQYEFIISDNYEVGFIQSFKETLKNDKKKIPEELYAKKKTIYNDIQSMVDSGKKEDDLCILESIFGMDDILKKEYSNDILLEYRDIQRLVMHFGIHILKKIIKELHGAFDFFVHHNENYYHISYNCFGDTPISDIKSIPTGHKGTHILIKFPQGGMIKYLKIDNKSREKGDVAPIELSLQSHRYQELLDDTNIEQHIDEFSYLDFGTLQTYDNTRINNKHLIVNYPKSQDITVSQFIRYLYAYALFNDTVDFYVYNFPLEAEKEYLELIVKFIIYYHDSSKEIHIPNVVFQSDSSFDIVYIGGNCIEDLKKINEKIARSYGFLENEKPSNEYKINDGTKLFYKLDNNYIVTPFGLFNAKSGSIDILEVTLDNYLNDNARDDLHIDTKQGYHIERFLEFKHIFEDSRWVKRLAFRLALEINSLWQQENDTTVKYQLFGTDKYTHMLIALVYAYLNSSKNNLKDQLKYKLFNIYHDYDCKNLMSEIKKCEDSTQIILISTVIFNGGKIQKIQNDFEYKKIKAISAIQLELKDQKPPVKKTYQNLTTIQNRRKSWKIKQKSFCKICQNTSRQIPLLEFAEEDPFFIKDTFFGEAPVKYIESYMEQKSILANWFDSLHFGHIERGSNHFLYYVNTVKFFNQNEKYIRRYLKVTKNKIQASETVSKLGNIKGWSKSDRYNLLDYRYYQLYKEGEKNIHDIIILTSSHDTNNNFIALVNEIVFDNDATVLSFDRSKAEANFHDLGSNKINWKKTKVYFVDDSIASGYTLEYFYQLLRFMPTIMDIQNAGLDGVIAMIDRMSSYDESLLCSYLKNDNQIFEKSKDRLVHKLKNIHTFASFEVKPIKTEIEECFLCKRKDRYLNLAKNAALDLTTFQMAKRHLKLRNVEYNKIDPARNKPRHERFKIYLKAMATDYVHREYMKHSKREDTYLFDDDFEKIHNDFSQKMYQSICDYKEHWVEQYTSSLLKRIIEFQSEIALLKAMSFPKLSYYYNVREMALKIINKKLQRTFNSTTKKEDIENFVLNHIFKEDISNIKKTNQIAQEEFLDYYAKMTLFHHVNIYFAILGYFRDTKVLDKQVIRFFHKVSQLRDKIEDKNKNKDIDLLHTYPFAVKFAIDNNLEKSNYFESNLQAVIKDNQGNLNKKKFAYLNALHLENTVWKKEDLKHSHQIDFKQVIHRLYNDTESPEEKFQNLKNDLFEKVFPDSEVKLFVSPYIDRKFNDYSAYLDKSENNLVDILNEYRSINSYEIDLQESVKKIFYGAENTAKDTDTDIVLTKLPKEKVYTKIDDTWSNEFNKEKGFVVVRLTSIDEDQLNKQRDIKQNKPVWFRPIGCIVVKQKGEVDHSFHLKVTRIILTIKKHLTRYLEREFSHGVMQEAIENQKLNYYLDDYDHNIGHVLDIRKIFETDIKIPYEKQGVEEEQAPSIRTKTTPPKFSYNRQLQEGIVKMHNYLIAPPLIVKTAQLPLRSEKKVNLRNIDMLKVLNDHKDEFVNALYSMSSIIDLIPEKKDIKIIFDKYSQYIIEETTEESIKAMLFEFCYNGAKHSGESLQIDFKVVGNKCVIENNVEDKTINLNIKRRGGTESIQKFLDNLKYKISYPTKIEKGKYIIIIERRGQQ